MADASLGTAVLRTKLDTTGLKTGLNQAKTETEKFGKDGVTAIKGIGAAFGAVATSQGVRAYISFMRSAAVEANQAATATELFQKAVRRNNESVTEGASMVQRLSDRFGVAANVIEDAATTMLRQGATLEQVEKTILTAGASAAAAGFDIATAFENVTTAVVSGNSVLLRSSGIIAGLGEAERAYAREVGKTVEQLTEQEKIQARVNAIYHETRYEIEDLDRILQGLPRAQAEVTRQMSVFRQTAGDLALKVITPLTQGLGAALGIFNSLPTPVKNAGIAMAGAAVGATALATGIVAIRAALQGLSGLGLLSFGPAGWVALGVTAVAGLAAALAGSDTSLEGAVGKAQKALSGGDAKSLTGALQTVSDRLAPSDPLRARLSELREELARTGEVGAEMAQTIADALNQAMIAPLKAELAALQAQVTTSERLLEGERDAAARNARIEELEREGNRILDEGGVVPLELTRELTQLRYAAEGLGMSSAEIARQEARIAADRVRIAELEKQIAALTSPSAATPPPGDGAPQGASDIQKRVTGLRQELAALQREVDVGIAEAATLAERQASAVDSAVRDLIRLGASDALVTSLLGDLSSFERAVRERAVRIAPIIRAEMLDERLRAERDAIEQMSRDAATSAQVAQQRRESEHLAAVARAPIIRAVAWDDAWFDERQEIEDMAIRAHNEARVAQQKRESEHLRAIARAPIIRAEEWDQAWFAEMEETEALQAELAAARVVRENRNQAAIRAIMNDYNRGGPGSSLFEQNRRYLDADVGRQAARMRGMDITTTNTDRDTARAREAEVSLARARAQSAAESAQVMADWRRSENERILALRYGGEAGKTFTQQVNLQSDAISLAAKEGITLTEALERITDSGRSIADVQADITKAEQQWRTAGDDAGRLVAYHMLQALQAELEGMQPRQLSLTPRATIDGMDPKEWEEKRRKDQAAAEKFSNTVVAAGFSFGDAAIRAFKDGDIVGVIRAGLSGAGSIFSGLDAKDSNILGTISLFGGSIGIGGLLAGGLGLLGTLLGGLFGGDRNRELEQRRQAEASRARSVPAININFTVNQTNTYNGAPSDPQNEQAFARQADALFESIYRRHLGPRLDRIENRLGIAGA